MNNKIAKQLRKYAKKRGFNYNRVKQVYLLGNINERAVYNQEMIAFLDGRLKNDVPAITQ